MALVVAVLGGCFETMHMQEILKEDGSVVCTRYETRNPSMYYLYGNNLSPRQGQQRTGFI